MKKQQKPKELECKNCELKEYLVVAITDDGKCQECEKQLLPNFDIKVKPLSFKNGFADGGTTEVKPKELDWYFDRLHYILWDFYVNHNPETIDLVEIKEKYFYTILTQQRTELLEEINSLVDKKIGMVKDFTLCEIVALNQLKREFKKL